MRTAATKRSAPPQLDLIELLDQMAREDEARGQPAAQAAAPWHADPIHLARQLGLSGARYSRAKPKLAEAFGHDDPPPYTPEWSAWSEAWDAYYDALADAHPHRAQGLAAARAAAKSAAMTPT